MGDEYSIDINKEDIIIEVKQQPDVEIQLNEQGPPGPPGNGIVSITKTSSQGGIDIYTIYYTNGDTNTFQVPTPLSAEWGHVQGNIADQTDLIDLIDTKIEIETTARENNDLSLQNGINTLNNDLTAEISNRETADGILQDNIDTLSGIVTSNYTTLDGKISDNKTAIDNHIADKNNPHEVTKEQIGLGNVDNTSDLNKPISTATQNELNTKVSNKREINGYPLSSDITLTALDVGALPDSTVIGNGTLTIQKNGSTIDTFGANDTGNTTVNITVPTDTSDLTNDSKFISNTATGTYGLTILGNPNSARSAINIGSYSSATSYSIAIGYKTNSGSSHAIAVGDSAEANGYLGTAIGPSALASSTESLAIGYGAEATNENSIQIGQGTNNIVRSLAVGFGTDLEYQLLNGTTGLIPDERISSNITRTSDLSTVATSGSYNDLTNKPTIPTVGNGTITINQGGVQKGTFTTNQSGNTTIDLDTGGGSSTDVQINGTSITSGGVANIVTNTAYNSSTNKIATMSDIPTKTSELTNDSGYTTNTGTVTSVNNISPVNGNVSLTIPTVGNGTITVTQGGVTKGTFTTNQSGNTTIDLDSGGSDIEIDDELSTTSENPVQNKIITNALEDKINKNDLATIATTGNYDDLINKPTIPSEVTESTVSGWGFTKNTGTVTSVNDVQPVNGNITLSIPEQVQANWNETNTSSKAYIQNKPTIPSTSNFVTTNTAQNVTARKTFVGEKAIYFKQSTSTNKLGFTLYNWYGTEVGGLEYNPSSNILALNAPKTGNTLVGFRYWGDNNIIVPKPSSSGNYYLPLSFKNGSSTVTTDSSGVADLSNLIPTIATSVSASSTNAETVGAKLFYDIVGDIETLLSEV